MSVLNLIGPAHVTATKEGRLVVDMLKGMNAVPVEYRAVALSVVTGAWFCIIIGGLSSLDVLSRRLDPWLTVMFVLSVVSSVGGALGMLWSTRLRWSPGGSWQGRLWGTVLARSSLVLPWVAIVYHLMSFGTRY